MSLQGKKDRNNEYVLKWKERSCLSRHFFAVIMFDIFTCCCSFVYYSSSHTDFLFSYLRHVCLPLPPIKSLHIPLQRYPSIQTPRIHTDPLRVRTRLIKRLHPTNFTKQMLGFLSIKPIFCQKFSPFRCKAKISSSGDEEVEETKLTAAAAVTFEKWSVFGDCAGEADATAVAAAVEGFGCCC